MVLTEKLSVVLIRSVFLCMRVCLCIGVKRTIVIVQAKCMIRNEWGFSVYVYT